MKLAERTAKLTRTACEGLEPEAKAYEVTFEWTPPLKSLKFVVEPSGRKLWRLRYKTREGRQSEVKLGEWPSMLPQKAYSEARALQDKISEGFDPGAEKRRAREERDGKRASTFALLSAAYMEASRRGTFNRRGAAGRKKAAGTLANEAHSLKLHVLPALGDRPIEEIKRKEIVALMERVALNGGPEAANKCLEVLRGVFAYGRHKELLETNPTLEVRPFPKEARDVIATDGQLKTLWWALEEAKRDKVFPRKGVLPSQSFATVSALQVAMLTLQRRAEVATMRREDLNLDKNLWTIPAVNKKERRKGLVPLSPKAKEIIEAALARSTSKAGYVFPGSDGEGQLEPHVMTRWLARLRDRRAEAETRVKAGKALPKDAEFLALPAFTDVTVHDLRRTGRTKLTGEELDVDERTAERVLNHSVGSHQQKAYDWNAYLSKKREALKLWEAELLRIVEGREPASPDGGQEANNVYQMRRSA